MSGGHFDYKQSVMRDIADAIEGDIALALKPKPQKVHEDYWTIYIQRTQRSYTHYRNCYCRFKSYEEAESYLLRDNTIEKADSVYSDKCFCEPGDMMFQSIKLRMDYDHYPYDMDVLDLSDESLGFMKDAYMQIRIAYIYAQRVDWMLSGDDSEVSMQQRLEEDLRAFEEEFKNKNWTE